MSYTERGKIRIEFSPEEVKILCELVLGHITDEPLPDAMVSCLPGLFAKLARSYTRTTALPIPSKA